MKIGELIITVTLSATSSGVISLYSLSVQLSDLKKSPDGHLLASED